MLVLFALLAAVVLGGLLGTLIVRDPGYVLVSYADWAMETSLWIALLLVLGFYIAVRVLLYAIRRGAQSQGWFLRWQADRRATKARKQTLQGLLLMAEGRWDEAKSQLVASAKRVETPFISYLNAARAAHELGKVDERDECLRLAHETTPGAKFAADLTQAEFRIDDHEYEQALAILLMMRKKAPKHKAVLRMLVKCYEAVGDWSALQAHLRDAADLKVLPPDEINRLSRLVWVDLLKAEASQQDVAELWKRLPKALKQDQPLLSEWVRHLRAAGNANGAEHVLRLILSNSWQPEFVEAYGMTVSDEVDRQLVTAQRWLRERPNDVDLLIALGRLAAVQDDLAAAREYFESALKLSTRPAIYSELGRVCIGLGEEKRGTDYLLRALGDTVSQPS